MSLRTYAKQIGSHYHAGPGENALKLFALGAASILEVIPAMHIYLDTKNGQDTFDGLSWEFPLKTMSAALAAVATNGVIHFIGDVREQLNGSNLKFDVTIIGHGNRPHHPDLPSAAYSSGAACWRLPASGAAATTPLLKARGRGWRFVNILFVVPSDAAAVYLERNADSGVSEYDASHASFIGCRFEGDAGGKVGIENAGGCGFVEVLGCRFYRLTASGGAGIKCTSTAVAVPLNWQIEDCHFANNASHILHSMSYSEIRRNIFSRFTQTLSVDIYNQPSAGQGEYNVITENYLPGTFNAATYPAGSNNEWAGNQNVAGVTTADPT